MLGRFVLGLLFALSVGAGPVARATPTAPAAERPVRIACIGDSITFGLGLEKADDTYPAQLQRLLGSGYVVRNFGHSGCTVTRDTFSHWPRGYARQPEFAEALSFQPDIVVCNLGINDVSDFAAAHRPKFLRDYLEIIAAFRTLPSHPRFILWHPLAPLFPGHAYYGHPAVREINALVAQVAASAGTETVDLSAPLSGHPEWFARDQIHPDAHGARRIAEAVRDYLVAHPQP